ncbi:maleylpyruvate isomerase N-terminal domain-containing protein [Allokutzneria sp. A3M-2-11 16]|uniref:maleylpyruvate isomerase N-terminal domain-containing protein n=1 Tax=Allokutzneria sp. A3M-2-11 16 TaxID=2962043 RepID=UPI0020B8B528|nr:maleylpyruvate isomerase N-terminal domain-containing protein [Allokutzneria sp. A3M-2-11 16]MCP3799040.1 maleylpyruvate isomerase N-terminal domain-containing protein [Allokutzneria sp. A3M-2-11 16]
MDHAGLVDQITEHSAALLDAAVQAGPGAAVPTCPEWTVADLVAHVARAHAWVSAIVETGSQAEFPEVPTEWQPLLDHSRERTALLAQRLREAGPDAPTWTFLPDLPQQAHFWSRRMAHDTAIHRLDAELARGVESRLIFDPRFAADGIDEALGWTPLVALRNTEASGSILFHAADAGRAWTLVLRAGKPVEVLPLQDSAIDADATMAGTADAIYRAIWNRPSTAIRTGDQSLFAALPAV